MADKRAYFKVDVGYFTNPKVALVLSESPLAVVLHLESVAYAAQHLTDGIVPKSLVCRLVGAGEDEATRLLDAGLWLATPMTGQVEVHDYLEHQRSAADAKKLSDAGRKAAETRWQSDSDTDGNADRMRNPMPRERERERENNTTASADAAAAFEAFWSRYPKKEGKGAAVKAWKAATKKAEPSAILAGLDARIASWSAASTERKFIPLPTTWLNQERWTDEIDRPRIVNPNIPEGWGSLPRAANDRRPEGW